MPELDTQKAKKVAELLGITEEAVMAAVLPSGATAFEQAKKVYDNTLAGSAAREQAMIVLVSFYTNVNQVSEAYKNERGHRGSELVLPLLKKWNELSLQELQTVETFEQAKEVYSKGPKYLKDDCPFDCCADSQAFEKMLSLCTTLDQAWEMNDVTPSWSEHKEQALNKYLSFCTTFEQAWKAYDVSNEYKLQVLDKCVLLCTTIEQCKKICHKTENDVYQKWGAVTQQALEKWFSLCITFEQAWWTYDILSDKGWESAARALDKCLLLCTTFEQAWGVLEEIQSTPYPYQKYQEPEQRLFDKGLSLCNNFADASRMYERSYHVDGFEAKALDRWLSFCTIPEEVDWVAQNIPDNPETENQVLKRRLSICTTFEQAWQIYYYGKSRMNGVTKRQALEVLVSLCTNLEQVRKVSSETPDKSEVRRQAIAKAYELTATE